MSQIYELLPKVAKAIGAIGKERRNQQQGFLFRGIDDIYDAAHGPLCEHGVIVTTEVSDVRTEERQTSKGAAQYLVRLKLSVTWHAPDGSKLTTTVEGEGSDMGDKATSKALSMAMKYAYFQTFTIPLSEQEDGDATTPEPSVPRQQAREQHPAPQKDIRSRVASAIVAYGNAKTSEDVATLDARVAKLLAECDEEQANAINEARELANRRIAGY